MDRKKNENAFWLFSFFIVWELLFCDIKNLKINCLFFAIIYTCIPHITEYYPLIHFRIIYFNKDKNDKQTKKLNSLHFISFLGVIPWQFIEQVLKKVLYSYPNIIVQWFHFSLSILYINITFSKLEVSYLIPV